MNERILKLEEAIKNEEAKITKLQAAVASKKSKVRELKNAEILRDLHVLETSGIHVREVIAAIKKGDNEALMKYIKEGEQKR